MYTFRHNKKRTEIQSLNLWTSPFEMSHLMCILFGTTSFDFGMLNNINKSQTVALTATWALMDIIEFLSYPCFISTSDTSEKKLFV